MKVIPNHDDNIFGVKIKPITGKSKRELLECISPLLIPENERSKEDRDLVDTIMGRNFGSSP